MSDLDLAPIGTYLPRPIIDRVEVYDNYLSITLSIYLTSPDGNDTATLLEDLEQLNYYLFYAMDSTTIQNLIEKKETIFSGLTDINSARPILKAQGSSGYINVNYRNSRMIASGFGTEADGSNSQWLLKETAGDNDAGFTYKYSTTIDHYFGAEPNQGGAYAPYNFIDLESGTSDFMGLADEYANIVIFAFSSTINLSESGNTAGKAFRTYDYYSAMYPIFKDGVGYTDESDQQGVHQAHYTSMYPTVLGQAARDQYLPDVLIDTQTSEVSYMSVFKDGKLDTNLMNVYVKADGARYETSPLKSLDARYYPTDRVNPDNITATVTELLSRYEALRSQDSQLDNMMDSIYYVLGAHADSVDFLGQLAALLSVWPSRVASRPIGRLFNEYQQTIGALNEALKSSGALSRQLSQNFKVIDKRGVVVADSNEYNADNLPWEGGAPDLYGLPDQGRNLDESRYIFNKKDNFLVSRQVYATAGDHGLAMNWGFFFIDYEKALRAHTVLARVLDLDRVESWFGKEMSNYGLQWVTAQIDKKFHNTDTSTSTFSMGKVVSGLPPMEGETLTAPIGSFPFVTNFAEDYIANSQPDASAFYPLTFDGFTQAGSDYSALYPRSFNFAREADLGDYRLACFYFQDYWGGDATILSGIVSVPPPSQFERYEVQASFGDRSAGTFLELVAAFSKAYTDFITYYDAAADNCSYNNTDGYFNDFFVTAMNEQYGNDLSQAPWVRMAIVYNLWDDLVNNAFAQNYTALVEAAKTRIARINPETGTLEGIGDFLTLLDNFWDDYLRWDRGTVALAFQDTEGMMQTGNQTGEAYPAPGSEHTDWVNGFTTGDWHPIGREFGATSPLLPPVFSELGIGDGDTDELEETYKWYYDGNTMFFFDKYLQSDEYDKLTEKISALVGSITNANTMALAEEVADWVDKNDTVNVCNPCDKDWLKGPGSGQGWEYASEVPTAEYDVWLHCKMWENPSHGGSNPTHPKDGVPNQGWTPNTPADIQSTDDDPDWSGYIKGDYEKSQKTSTGANKSPDAYVKCWVFRAAPDTT